MRTPLTLGARGLLDRATTRPTSFSGAYSRYFQPTSRNVRFSSSGSPLFTFKSNLSGNGRLYSTSKPPFDPIAATRARQAQRNRNLLMYSAATMLFALGASYAAVPLYRAFCAATGYAGTPKTGMGKFEPERLHPVTGARRIKVTFNSATSEALPWTFTPQQKHVWVLPGETSLAFYTAKNTSKEDVIGIATYNVLPDRVAPYFAKVECFCFEEQKLLAGEEVDMPLFFFIDKDILDDPGARNVTDVVLNYTFFKARRNKQGHLEPDAAKDVVDASLGWSHYEHAEPIDSSSDAKGDTAVKPSA